jgi:uncharacterized membrane protein YsdA (DUF1294 family)
MSIYSLIYLAAVSLLALIITIHDKNAARKKVRRVKERTLLIISVLGGSVAMLLAMLAIRHKTRHKKFMIGIPLIIICQVLIIILLNNSAV